MTLRHTLTLEKEQAAFEKNWHSIVEEIKWNLQKDPNSKLGIDIGKKTMDFVNAVYGKKYAHLRTKFMLTYQAKH